MHDIARRSRILRGDTGTTRWEMAVRPPRPELRPYIRDFCGYAEHAAGLVRRFEFPVPQIVVIIEFGPPVRVFDAGQVRRSATYGPGFVAGLDDRFSLVEHDGLQRGLQLNLTPIGGRVFFGVPMSELTGRVVALSDLLERDERHLAARLEALPDWDARFDLIEDLVAARVVQRSAMTDTMAWACGRIARAHGRTDVTALARELGYSHRHTIALFRDHVGVPPKLLSRLARFDRLLAHLRSGGEGSWADLALRFGYYDQSHLVRDVRQFTGSTPTAARASLDTFAQAVSTI